MTSATGLLTSITDPLVHLTSFTYDSARRLESTTDPFGGIVTQTYDTTSGEVATMVDQLVRTTTYLRDTMGRVTTITHAGWSETGWQEPFPGKKGAQLNLNQRARFRSIKSCTYPQTSEVVVECGAFPPLLMFL